MAYYAMQVITRSEDKYINAATLHLAEEQGSLHFPRRALTIRSHGKMLKTLEPVFPGYIFYKNDSDDFSSAIWKLRHIDGFVRFLKSNKDIQALEGRDLELLLHFISRGEVADTSKVRFDENDRIVVLTGPLKGLEGYIVKVDRRKGRAKLHLDMCGSNFRIDLGFETLVKRAKDGPEDVGG